MANNGLIVLGIGGAIAYLTRDSWLPQLETTLGVGTPAAAGTGATGNNPSAPTTTTANQPITINTPGAVPIGNQGCFSYSNGTAGSTVINCPPGVSPPAAAAPATGSCAAGFTQDAAGVCTLYPDAVLLANLNTIPWTGLSDIPTEQIMRIDPQILSMYSTTTGVNGGTALAYMLGLGSNPADGAIINGTDGNAYKALAGVFYRQGTATSTTATVHGVPRMGRLGQLAAALPITNATLIMASADPRIAALVGRDERAMLSAAQWNAYYTQATGIVQGIPLHPGDDRQALMSAEQYQARRLAAGLAVGPARLGLIRSARRGAFPLGGLGYINQWVPPGNRTIYQIPGRGAVPAGRGGRVPARTLAGNRMGLIQDGGGNHRWARSPFPRPSWWREPNAQ
jgi:hypothetical protein